jgi:hypothetical protein
MVRLTRLRIDRFRNVKPGTELRFGPTFNVLLGKNATGKSTLLDLVAAVTNDNLSAYANEEGGFALTWWLEHGDYEVRVEARRTLATTNLSLDAVPQNQEFDEAWVVAVQSNGVDVGQAELSGTRGVWKVAGKADVPFEGRGPFAAYRGSERVLVGALAAVYRSSAKPNQEKRLFPVHPAQAVFRHAESAGRLDEALASLEAITRSPFDTGPGSIRWDGWLPRVVRDRLGPRALNFYGMPGLEDIPVLLGFVQAELHPRVLTRSEDGKHAYDGFDVLFRRADGSEVRHDRLSFGQKRLFSFLWYLAVREQLPVVADELFNGLHHDWIELCIDRLHDRQSFLATQHPYLLDHVPIESVAGIRETFVRCTLEKSPDGREQMAWRNFDEEEAERFFRAYQTGIPQVSEVLRMEGLW